MGDDKRPRIHHFSPLSPPSSSSCETREADELKDASIEVTVGHASAENDHKEQNSKRSSSSSSSANESAHEEKKPLQILHEEGVGGGARGCEGSSTMVHGDCGRERLKRHRVEVAGRVWIPDMWGQEDLLKDWIDCSAFDASLVSNKIMSARSALMDEGRRANSNGLRIGNSC